MKISVLVSVCLAFSLLYVLLGKNSYVANNSRMYSVHEVSYQDRRASDSLLNQMDSIQPFISIVPEQSGARPIEKQEVKERTEETSEVKFSEEHLLREEIKSSKSKYLNGEFPQIANRSKDRDSSEHSSTRYRNESTISFPVMPNFYPSKDLFVRAVYFDDRPRDGHHNTSVFLVVCIRNITDNELIVGCQVDGRQASKFRVKLIGETPLWRAFYNKINHEEVLVHCYDLPAKNGSSGYIMYRMSPNSNILVAASERPLTIPPPRIKPSSLEGMKYNMTIITCAKIFGKPPWLEEWLRYQRTLGVDHVHLDMEDSFKGMNMDYIQKAIQTGFLSVDVWKEYLGVWEVWYHNQGLIYEDCPYRFKGTYDYILMLDTDDFFIPRQPDQLKLHYYINKYCRGNKIGSCKFKWVEYFPDVFGFSNISTTDGNITRGLRNYSHYNQGNPKSIHRTTVLIDTATHYAYLMMPGYKIVDVSVNVAYVAHVRKFKQLPKTGLVAGIPNTSSEHVINRLLLAGIIHLVIFI